MLERDGALAPGDGIRWINPPLFRSRPSAENPRPSAPTIGGAFVAVRGSQSGLHTAENPWLLLPDQRISKFSKVSISKVDRQKGFDVQQNAGIRQFYGCHFGSAADLQLGERLLQSQNTCVGDVGAGEDQCVEAGDGF